MVAGGELAREWQEALDQHLAVDRIAFVAEAREELAVFAGRSESPRREPARTRYALSHSHSKATVSMSGAPASIADEPRLRARRGERRRCGGHACECECERVRVRAGLEEPPVFGGLRSCPSRVSQRPKRGAAMAGVARPRPPGARGRRSPRAWLLRQPLLARPDGTDRAGAKPDPGGAVAADGHAVRRRV